MSALAPRKRRVGWAPGQHGGGLSVAVLSLRCSSVPAAIARRRELASQGLEQILHAHKGYLAGYLLSIVVQIFTCLLMIGLFVAAVRL
jgi:hypothetical protein